MAGYTGFSVGLVNNRDVYIPMEQIIRSSPRSMSPYGTTWERVLAMTGQPNTAPAREEPQSMGSEADPVFPELTEPHVM